MDQRTHSWIAIRAIALLEDLGHDARLVNLLKPHARIASTGAWIPDQVDAKRGGAGSSTDNHVLKMEPYQGPQVERFTVEKDKLLEQLGMFRMTAQFLGRDNCLDDAWWKMPYRGDVPKPGQHLPNRIMALGTMLKDLVLLGDQEIDDLLRVSVRFVRDLDPELRTHEQAAAMYFFMLSHFVADISMPCHCDGRKLSAYGEGLHKELEAHWSKKVGTGFEKGTLLKEGLDSDQILRQARDTDSQFGLQFDVEQIPGLHPDHDAWLDAMFLCRASFALASVIVPYQTYRYDDTAAAAPFEQVLGRGKEQILAVLDQTVMHDAVLNTAIIWKDVWDKVSQA